MFTYLFDGFLRRVFSLLRAGGILYIYIKSSGLKTSVLLVQDFFRFFTRSLVMKLVLSVHDDISVQNWYSLTLFPLTAEGTTSALGFWPIIRLYLLPSPVRRFFRTTISFTRSKKVQKSVGFHSDLDLLLRPRGIDLDSYSSLNGHSLGGRLI